MARAKTRRLETLAASALLAAALVAPERAAGQELVEPRARQGYYLTLAVHGVAAGVHDAEVGWRGPQLGPVGELRLGEAIADWLDLGVAFGVGAVYDDDYRLLVGHVSLEAQLRPVGPLFVRLAVGVGFTGIERRRADPPDLLGRFGDAYRVAAGWELTPFYDEGESGGFAVAPLVWFEAGPGAEFTALLGGVGLEITWWTGLAKNELDLPFDEAYASEE